VLQNTLDVASNLGIPLATPSTCNRSKRYQHLFCMWQEATTCTPFKDSLIAFCNRSKRYQHPFWKLQKANNYCMQFTTKRTFLMLHVAG